MDTGSEARPCRVRLDANSINLDGERTDLAMMAATCRAAGSAEVTATGAAIAGAVAEVLIRLQEAGVVVRTSPDLWDLVGTARSTRTLP